MLLLCCQNTSHDEDGVVVKKLHFKEGGLQEILNKKGHLTLSVIVMSNINTLALLPTCFLPARSNNSKLNSMKYIH